MLYERSKAKKVISNRDEIKLLVSHTMNEMAAVVAATLGPGGRAVLIERDGLSPLITKDGVTVAKSLGVSNAEANIIIEAAKEICLNTAKQAGDGTTTAIVLANAITKHGLEFLANNPKYNPQRMINELNQAYEEVVVPFLKNNAIVAKGATDLINVAQISANGDRRIAQAVVDAVLAAGDDGTVLIEEAQGNQLKVDTIDGYITTSGLKDLGAIGPIFMNDRAGQQAKLDKGLVFLYDGSINDLKVPAIIQETLEGTEYYGLPIVVMAHGFADTVLDRFAKTTKGGYTVIPVKTPLSGVANSRSMFLHDMAAYSGAMVFDPGNIDEISEKHELKAFGTFDSARINLYECFLSCSSDSDRIEQRVAELKAIAETAPSDFDKMHIRAAVGKLTGGISTIWIGGGSELETREKKARVEDAVEAVRSAIAEGVIPGGCAAHLVLSDILSRSPKMKDSWAIMIKALKAPFEQLLINCGEDVGSVWSVLREHVEGRDTIPDKIFDADEHKIVDPMSVGIIEPAKVCRVSVGNALSVASLLITLGGVVVVPRNSDLESQLEMSKATFREMMAGGGMEQE
jgi:chaperonin GroEL